MFTGVLDVNSNNELSNNKHVLDGICRIAKSCQKEKFRKN